MASVFIFLRLFRLAHICIQVTSLHTTVAYAENFHGGGDSLSGMWWSFVFGVRCL